MSLKWAGLLQTGHIHVGLLHDGQYVKYKSTDINSNTNFSFIFKNMQTSKHCKWLHVLALAGVVIRILPSCTHRVTFYDVIKLSNLPDTKAILSGTSSRYQNQHLSVTSFWSPEQFAQPISRAFVLTLSLNLQQIVVERC